MLKDVPISGNFQKPLWEVLEDTNFTVSEHIDLRKLCENVGIDYLCTPFSAAASDLLFTEIGVSAFKTGSGELTNHPFQAHTAGLGLPMIVSTGMSEIGEIDEVVSLHHTLGTQLALMHCVSIYPCPYERVNLDFIPKMSARYNVPVGLSCHTPTPYTGLGAVSLGASIIEKHFTLDRGLVGPDHQSSILPHELKILTEGADALFKARGDDRKIFDEELEIVRWARESVVSLCDIPPNTTITKDMIGVKRPSPINDVFPAKDFENVIGRISHHLIRKDKQVRQSDLK